MTGGAFGAEQERETQAERSRAAGSRYEEPRYPRARAPRGGAARPRGYGHATWNGDRARDRGRRYSTSSSWASRSRSPPPQGHRTAYVPSRGGRSRSRSSEGYRRKRSVSPGRVGVPPPPPPTTMTTTMRRAPVTRRSRSRSPRSPRSDSRSRSRSRTRSTRSRSRTRSRTRSPPSRSPPPPAPHIGTSTIPRAPSSFLRRPTRMPPTGPAAEVDGSASAGRGYIPTGPRGRGRGPPIAPRAPRAERLGYAHSAGPFRGPPVRPVAVPQPAVPPAREEPVAPVVPVKEPAVSAPAKEEPVPVKEPAVPVVPDEPAPAPVDAAEPKAELLADRESKIKIQFKRDAEPTAPERTAVLAPKLLASSPVAALSHSSPATPLEKPVTASPAKIGSSPVDYGSLTPGPVPEDTHKSDATPVRKPSHIALPPASHSRSRASSTAIPPTPGVRTPHPGQPGQASHLRHSTSYMRPVPSWKEYPPPSEVRWRERPTAAGVLVELKALGAVLPDDGYRGLADRDATRIAGDWERQVSRFLPCRGLY